MTIAAAVLVALIALLHIYILVLEMFLWTSPRAQKAFDLTADFARSTKTLAANQGLYNGFLAAGLIWGLLYPTREIGWQICIFFLACVAVAGLYGAATANRKILLIQTIPAVIAIIAVMFA